MIKLNGTEFNITIFPDKTSQVWQLPEVMLHKETKRFDIDWVFESEAELFHLCQLIQLIKTGRKPVPLTLNLPYLPYGRQDKELSNESTFALNTFSKIINALGFDKVTSIDAHSNVASDLIDNFESITPSKEISKALRAVNATAIAFPDAGASDRYKHLDVCIGHTWITGYKVRDNITGYIEKYDIEGDPSGKDVLIIDDLVDGGMTFILLTKDLLKAGAKSVNLYISHGIFSKGTEVLFDAGIKRIFTHKGEVK